MKDMIRFFAWTFSLWGLGLVLEGGVSALCVSNSFANLRAAPGTQHEQTGRVFRFTPLKEVSKHGRWHQVEDLDGNRHWVREDLVSRDFRCAVVKNEYANLRAGPGTNHAQVGAQRADRLVAFRLIREQGAWVELEDVEGDRVWIHRPLLWIPR
ncbi:MAG: hypothetical protein EA369_00850 [Bradymonadales bacterium]|nr:MAG: hypothetical protein EA369_00850 [Bradymonadales bacterium]